MPHRKRKVFEQGHQRKLMLVVDDSPEFEAALIFAARVAARTKGSLCMLYVIGPADFHHWIGVESIRRDEETNRAKALFRLARIKLKSIECVDIDIEEVIREGNSAEEIINQIEDDEDIAVLVLGAASDADGPGPLVSSLASGKGAGDFPIPIYLVPGNLTFEDIEALA